MNEQAIDMTMDDLEAPVWPKVVGVTSIVWAALNTGCMGCGMAGLLMTSLMGSSMQNAFPDGMPPTLQHPPITIWVNYVLGFGLALFLITSGIVLLLRKPIARPMHLLYGGTAIVLATVGILAGWQMQSEINEWCQLHPDTAYAKQAVSGQAFQWIGLAIGAVLGFGWPTFCLIWFGAVKRDSQEIARGVEMLV